MSGETLSVPRPAADASPAVAALHRLRRPVAAAALVIALAAASAVTAGAVTALLPALSGPLGFAVLVTFGLAAVAAAPVAVRWGLLAARDALVAR